MRAAKDQALVDANFHPLPAKYTIAFATRAERTMQIDWDRVLDFTNLAVAVAAIWLAIVESRRGNSVILKLRECSGYSTQPLKENSGNSFHVLKIIVQNRGISLHNIRASLGFLGPDGHGWCNAPLPNNVRASNDGEFARGMIAEFTTKTYKLDRDDAGFLLLLRNPRQQKAVLTFWSQDYLVASFRIGGVWDRAKIRWNRFAFWASELYTYKRNDVRHNWLNVPRLPVLENAIVYFIQKLEEDRDRQFDA